MSKKNRPMQKKVAPQKMGSDLLNVYSEVC